MTSNEKDKTTKSDVCKVNRLATRPHSNTSSVCNVHGRPSKERVKSAPPARVARDVSRPSRVSDRLNPKTVDAFDRRHSKSVFACAYNRGDVPCHLVHGSVKHTLKWRVDPEQVTLDPTLIIMAEGLKETVHPYSFVAHEGFKKLLTAPHAQEELGPLLPNLTTPLKAALVVPDEKCFLSTLECIVLVSHLSGPDFNQHIRNILPQISRRMNSKKLLGKITESLQEIELNGGPQCTTIIKSRIPTYATIL